MVKRHIFAVLAVVGFAGAAQADVVNQTRAGTAIGGYDPVAYFSEGRAVEGEAAFETEWNGATWRFSSASNKAAFEAGPEKYAPQYGGYCAYAAARNYVAGTDPEAWSIVDGALYLNYSARIRRAWRRDVSNQIAQGDRNWPGLEAELARSPRL